MPNKHLLSSIPKKLSKSSENVSYKIREKNGIIEIYSLHAIYYLKDVEKDIWTKIDGSRTINEIINMLIDEYQGDEEVIMKETLNFIIRLRDKNLVTMV